MRLDAAQANHHGACASETAFSVAPVAILDASSGVSQASQANSYCTRVSLFSEWKRKCRDYNKETPVSPVPAPENRTGDSKSADSWHKPTPVQPVPAPSLNLADWVSVPLEACIIDPLYTGRLTGKVPDGWTREGWIIATWDRLKRTRDPVGRRRLRAELRAVEAEAARGGR